MKHLIAPLALSLAFAAPAFAQEAGSFTVGLGFGHVAPKENNGALANMRSDIGTDVRPVATFEYFVQDNLGVELLLATPFKHAISLEGAGEIGETKHLPPTLSLNYHFANQSAWTPFLGLGLNYTKFFEEKSSLGALKIKESFGLSATLGLDYALDDTHALRADLRYIDIDSDVYLNGDNIGKVNVDPFVTSISYVTKF